MITVLSECLLTVGIELKDATEKERALAAMLQREAEALVSVHLQKDLGWKQHVEYFPPPGYQDGTDGYDDEIVGAERTTDGVILYSQRIHQDRLILKHSPVYDYQLEVRVDRAANANQAADAFGASTVLTQGVDYWLDIDMRDVATPIHATDSQNISRTGILYHATVWPLTPRSIQVTYWGGETWQDNQGTMLVLSRAIKDTFRHLWIREEAGNGIIKGQITSGSMGPEVSFSRAGAGSGAAGDTAVGALPPTAQQTLWSLRDYSLI